MAQRITKTIAESSHQINNSGANTVTTSNQTCGTGSSNAGYVGSRFTSIAIEQGATINRATLRLSLTSITTSGTQLPQIKGHDHDNSPALGTSTNYLSGLTQTTASHGNYFRIDDLGAGYYEVDVTDIVQEIIDRVSWASGNAITLILLGFDASTTATVNNRSAWELEIIEGATDSGALSPTTNSGSWTNPTNAYADGGGYATMDNSTNGAHQFSTFDFSGITAGATIYGFEVRVDAWSSSVTSRAQFDARISKDGGSTWSSWKSSTKANSSQETYLFGVGDDWDIAIAESDLDNDIVVEVRNNFSSSSYDGRYDWVSVRVYYAVESSTTAIQKSLAYKVITTPTAITKSLQYNIRGTKYYTREANASLPTTDGHLATKYSASEVTDVDTDDNTRVDIDSVNGNYLIHQFEVKNANDTDNITISWNGQTLIAPSLKTVYLQIYNYNTASWETLDSDNTTAKNTDFDLSGSITSNQTYYYDASNYARVRVYQAT